VARFLAVLYTNQKVRVQWGSRISNEFTARKWGSRISNEFTARNGVKQGGVLSPVLFSIYTDELLISLEKSGVGCHIGHLFCGAFAYVDEVIILAPTICALNHMLKIAERVGTRLFLVSFLDQLTS
jgi:hypothetical protein